MSAARGFVIAKDLAAATAFENGELIRNWNHSVIIEISRKTILPNNLAW
jgi:hypothetical protein